MQASSEYTARIQREGEDTDECAQRQADAEPAVGTAILAGPVAQEQDRHGVHDEARAGAEGRAGIRSRHAKGQVKQQPGADKEEPELQRQQHGPGYQRGPQRMAGRQRPQRQGGAGVR